AKTKLGFIIQPSNVVAGATISPVVAVAIQDALGNTVSSAVDNVTVALGTNPGGATLGGTLTKAASSGTALFANLTPDKTGTGSPLTAAAGGLRGTTGTPFTVTAGSASSVVKISGDNQTGAGGAALAQPLIVEVRDALANPVPGVTVNWATPSGGGAAPPPPPPGGQGPGHAARAPRGAPAFLTAAATGHKPAPPGAFGSARGLT